MPPVSKSRTSFDGALNFNPNRATAPPHLRKETDMVLIWIGFAVLTAIAADKRNRSIGWWAAFGLLFGPFALGAVLMMGKLSGTDDA